MSTAFFPTNMRSMPSGGRNHNSTYENIPYISWKGTGVFSNPVGIASTHIRPLTNNDTGNVFQTGFGLPRPIKHYRKGRVIPVSPILIQNPNNPNEYIESLPITYNTNRNVASSKGSSLGGGAGGRGLLSDLMGTPGSYIVKQNSPDEVDETIELNKDCNTCQGVGVVTTYYPNNTYLTENPEANTQNKVLCCNEQSKARRRVLPASTNLSQKYYTTLQQYRQNRCKTFQQREFNFQSGTSILNNNLSNIDSSVTPEAIASATAGSPLALLNTYFANCQPNAEIYNATQNALVSQMISIMVNQSILTTEQVQEIEALNINTIKDFFNYLLTLPQPTQNNAISVFEAFINNPYWGMPLTGPTNPTGCKTVIYKPNNYQYAKQGAVDSSSKLLKLKVDTITTNAASFNNYNANQNTSVPQLTNGIAPPTPFILKYKVPGCNTPNIFPYQNKKACNYNSTPNYRVPISQPSPYRNYPGTVFTSNNFSNLSNTYLSR
jgi:hypothetical protein